LKIEESSADTAKSGGWRWTTPSWFKWVLVEKAQQRAGSETSGHYIDIETAHNTTLVIHCTLSSSNGMRRLSRASEAQRARIAVESKFTPPMENEREGIIRRGLRRVFYLWSLHRRRVSYSPASASSLVWDQVLCWLFGRLFGWLFRRLFGWTRSFQVSSPR
jgi:hypothetical protein